MPSKYTLLLQFKPVYGILHNYETRYTPDINFVVFLKLVDIYLVDNSFTDSLFQWNDSCKFLTLSPLAVNFDARWWPMQTIWIQMKPHKMWGFIWDPNCLTFRLYISKIFATKHWFFASFERKKIFEKILQH